MTDRISRSYDFTISRTETRDDGLTLEGHAAVFNDPTEINSWEGTFEERIAPGAFTKTIQERSPILQFDHGTHPMIGSIPLGSIKQLREDDVGLFVRARLSDNWLVEPVRDAIRDGGVTGMSFQFTVTKDDWNDERTQRTIREVKLYELGPVVWPAYPTTDVGVRSDIANLLSCDNIRQDLARSIAFYAEPEAATRTSGEDDKPPVEALVTSQAVARTKDWLRTLALPSEYIKE